jgi:hypothetical protein
MAAWRVIGDARAAWAPSIAPEQIGGDARFIHEDVLPGVVQRQRLDPVPPRRRDVSPPLFGGVYRFF